MRPWTIMYSTLSKWDVKCTEKTGPFDGSDALEYFKGRLPKDCSVLALVPGSHSSNVILARMNEDEGDEDGNP